ncbi:MAG: hypothetical protein ABSC71_04610 [Candidatus Acidiferrales bacterium]|jgi:hypothetical protein
MFTNSPFIRKTRWLWFALALLLLVQTPLVVAQFVRYGAQKRGMYAILVVALFFRAAWIWFFGKMWWDTRHSAPPAPQS